MAGGKKGCLTLLVVFVAAIFLLYPLVKGVRERLALLDQGVKDAWAKLEGSLQRRMDLIPNYVEIVRNYAPQEHEACGEVTALHLKASIALTRPLKVEAHMELSRALKRLCAAAGRYPDLARDQRFQRLQDELTALERDIAEGCARYNEAITAYNAYRNAFPADIIAPFLGYGSMFPLEVSGEAESLVNDR